MTEREEITIPPIATEWVLTQLVQIAKTGISKLTLGNPLADTLAATISSLVNENEYLKKILGARLLVTPDASKISIAFGPANRFVLDIPVSSDQEKRDVAAALSSAAAKILHDIEHPPKTK